MVPEHTTKVGHLLSSCELRFLCCACRDSLQEAQQQWLEWAVDDLEEVIPIKEHSMALKAAIELDPEKRPTNDQLLVRSRSLILPVGVYIHFTICFN